MSIKTFSDIENIIRKEEVRYWDNMNIRKAEEKDIERIIDLSIEFDKYLIGVDDSLTSEIAPRELTKQILSDGFDNPYHTFLVAEEDGEVIAFSDMWTYPEFVHGGYSAYLQNIFVTERYRRTGIGTKLLNALVEDAKKRNAVALHISMKLKNKIAIDFYKKNGITEELMLLETRLDK